MTDSVAAASPARPRRVTSALPRCVTSARCSEVAQPSTNGSKTEFPCSKVVQTSTKGPKTELQCSKTAKSSTDIGIEGTKQIKVKIMDSDIGD